MFTGKFYKQVDGVTIGSPLDPTLTNAFLVHFERNLLQNCPSDFKPYYYRRYVDDIFVLFTSPQHLEAFRNFLNGQHITCHLRQKVKSKTECPFLMYRLFVKIRQLPPMSTVNVPLVGFIHILTAFYHLPIGFGIVYILAHRCLRIGSSCTKLHNELVCLK